MAMSKEYSKREYTCFCGMDHGRCDGESYFLMMYSGVSDLTRIVHRNHVGTAYESTTDLGHFADEQLSALTKLLSSPDNSPASAEDIEILRK